MFSTHREAIKNLVSNSDPITHDAHGGKICKLLLILYICLQTAQQWLMNHSTNRLQDTVPYMMDPNKCYLITFGKCPLKNHWEISDQ